MIALFVSGSNALTWMVTVAPAETEGENPEGREALVNLEGADATFFSEIVKGVVRRQREIDPLVDQQLRTGWRLVRVDSILRAILRGGVFELLERRDVPARVTINEYINIAKAFFEADEPKVVNGVLDRIAHKVRAKEFEAPGEDS